MEVCNSHMVITWDHLHQSESDWCSVDQSELGWPSVAIPMFGFAKILNGDLISQPLQTFALPSSGYYCIQLNHAMESLNSCYCALINQKLHILLEFSALAADTVCIGLARVGAEDQKVVVGTLQQLTSVDLGGPLHSLIIPGDMHPLELDMLRLFALDDTVKSLLSSSKWDW